MLTRHGGSSPLPRTMDFVLVETDALWECLLLSSSINLKKTSPLLYLLKDSLRG